MNPILTILIPAIPEHNELLTNLIVELNKQTANLYLVHPSLGEVEIIYDRRVKGFLMEV